MLINDDDGCGDCDGCGEHGECDGQRGTCDDDHLWKLYEFWIYEPLYNNARKN